MTDDVNNTQLKQSLYERAESAVASKNWNEAERTYIQLLNFMELNYGAKHFDVVSVMYSLAQVLDEQGRSAEADRYRNRVNDILSHPQ